MTRDEQENGGRQQLAFAQLVPAVARRDQGAQEIVTGGPATLVEQVVKVGGEVKDRGVARLEFTRGQQELGVQSARQEG